MKYRAHPPTPFDALKESVHIIKQCPVCNKNYTDEVIHILEETEETTLIHITCPSCKSALVASISTTELGMGLVGVVTDLNENDVMRMRENDPFSEDDLLEFYSLITHHSHQLAEKLAERN